MLTNTTEVFQKIAILHQQVRDFVERREPECKVTSIGGMTETSYKVTLQTKDEIHPLYADFILTEVQVKFRVSMRHMGKRTKLVCEVLVTSEGEFMIGDRLASEHWKPR